jgi:hypothetical protein
VLSIGLNIKDVIPEICSACGQRKGEKGQEYLSQCLTVIENSGGTGGGKDENVFQPLFWSTGPP